MTVTQIKEAIESKVEERGCFLVDVIVSKDNEIEIVIEKQEGSVSMDDCVFINDFILSTFDREEEHYALTVGSAGLDQAFKLIKQYKKALGTMVQLGLKSGGKKLVGLLTDVTDEYIILEYISRERAEGEKKSIEVKHNEKFYFSDINFVQPYLDI